MEVKCTTQDRLPLSELVEFQGNLKARTDDDYRKIEKSIKKHGFSFPFFVWSHDGINHVLDGHGRIGALKRMVASGEIIPDLPVVYVNCKDQDEAKEILLKLNSSYGHMTADSVKEFLGDLEIDFEDLELPEGILDLSEIKIDKPTIDDDEVPDVEEEKPDSVPGTVYELGPHRVMCGDSCSAEDMATLMNGSKADLIVTDPPYNVNYEGTAGKIQNDNMDDVRFRNFLTDAFRTMFGALKAGGAYYIWHADSEGYNFRTALKAAGGLVRQCLIWVKSSLVLGRQDYQWIHEPCLYGWKEGAGHYWDGRRDLTTVIDEEPDYSKMTKEELLKLVTGIQTSIIREDKPKRSDEHPTMKPVKLFMRHIENSSKEEDLVLDPFGGSGTTVIACAKLNRCARVMELDPHYCDVIRRRWTTWAKDNGLDPGPGALD